MEIQEYKICENVGDLKKVLEFFPDDMSFMGNLSDLLKVVVVNYCREDLKCNDLFQEKLSRLRKMKKEVKNKSYRFMLIKEANLDDLQLCENL